jgi:hypothetical protein
MCISENKELLISFLGDLDHIVFLQGFEMLGLQFYLQPLIVQQVPVLLVQQKPLVIYFVVHFVYDYLALVEPVLNCEFFDVLQDLWFAEVLALNGRHGTQNAKDALHIG